VAVEAEDDDRDGEQRAEVPFEKLDAIKDALLARHDDLRAALCHASGVMVAPPDANTNVISNALHSTTRLQWYIAETFSFSNLHNTRCCPRRRWRWRHR